MKKKRFIYIMLGFLLLSYNSISAYEYHNEKTDIENLLNRRIEIMNEFLYGEKNLIALENNLMEIENGNLLENDLAILSKVIDNPTDYELAMSVAVEKINTTQANDECLLINADLSWQMRGYDGEFNLLRNYDIKCVEIDKDLYLTSLRLND